MCCQTDAWRAGDNPERRRFFSSVKSLLLNHRQIFSPSLLLCLYSHPFPLVCLFFSPRWQAACWETESASPTLCLSPYNSHGEKVQVGDIITVNRFFLHSTLPEASSVLFTVAYKVLILPLLTVAYKDSVYQRLAVDCSHHKKSFFTLAPQEKQGWSLLNGITSLSEKEEYVIFIMLLTHGLLAKLKQ